MGELRFDGRVAVITGAGAGLGRAYALLFAARGAKVVVNDLGGGRHGDGSSSKAADAVVEEIRKNGGTAVADYNSVVEGEKIIKTALDAFGRVDILVNNAGILRDKSFARISDQDWDMIHAVHLKGSFKTTQAAFPIFKKQNYGRVIMTSSNSGLYGNFGQANYSAAKMGLVGLANTVAIEGRKNNIHCNVIVPTAGSRLTEDILPPDLFAELKPEYIAPTVAWMCHENCEDNGVIIESAAGWAGKCHLIRSDGKFLRSGNAQQVSIEQVRDAWDSITNMKNASHLESIQEATGNLVTLIQRAEGSSAPSEDGVPYSYAEKDVILYSLGVGASVGKPEELRYLYENHEDFQVLPTFATIPPLMSILTIDNADVIPGKQISFENLLHGEQYLEVMDVIPTSGKLRSKAQLVEKLDKGSGSVLVYDVATTDESGKLLFKNQIVTFIVGAGGWGGPRTGTKIVPCLPKPSRSPDTSATFQTQTDQAAIYRLSGDTNPLHIDPNMAIVAGFERPILHGLCTLGISVRLVLATYAGNDAKLFKALKCRFVKPVIPGQSIKVDMWREGNRVHFETSVVENNKVVISGSYVDLKSVVSPSPAVEATTPSTMVSLQSDAIFEFIIEKIKEDPSRAKGVNGVFLYNITKDGKQVKQWTMDLKKTKVYSGPPQDDKPNTTLTISDEDFVSMATGKLNPQSAFMKGKLKVSGNVMLAQKLGPLLKSAEAKL